MNSRISEVYGYYKHVYPQIVSLFRVNNSYEAYFEDAQRISPLIGLPVEGKAVDGGYIINVVTVPAIDIWDHISTLTIYGINAKLISQRNSDGKYDLPDIKLIKSEQEMDY